MRKDRYVLFETVTDASAFLDRLNAELGEVWDQPNKHPFDERALVSWNDQYLAGHTHLIDGNPQLTPAEAEQAGWTFGRLTGPFAHARAKLEEAQLLHSAITVPGRLPNLPVYRALYFGFLAATYAIKESIRKTCQKLGGEATAWYEEQWGRLQEDPVLKGLYQLNNLNKHEPSALPLKVETAHLGNTRIIGATHPGQTNIITSAEGVFGIQNLGTSRERVVELLGEVDARWEVTLDLGADSICGPATGFADRALNFYQSLVFNARKNWGGEPDLVD